MCSRDEAVQPRRIRTFKARAARIAEDEAGSCGTTVAGLGQSLRQDQRAGDPGLCGVKLLQPYQFGRALKRDQRACLTVAEV